MAMKGMDVEGGRQAASQITQGMQEAGGARRPAHPVHQELRVGRPGRRPQPQHLGHRLHVDAAPGRRCAPGVLDADPEPGPGAGAGLGLTRCPSLAGIRTPDPDRLGRRAAGPRAEEEQPCRVWALSLRASPEAGVPSADVRVHARPDATVADLARALGGHLAPAQHGLLLVPTEGSHPWPADRRLAECGLRTGDLLDVVSAPESLAGPRLVGRAGARGGARDDRAGPRQAGAGARERADDRPRRGLHPPGSPTRWSPSSTPGSCSAPARRCTTRAPPTAPRSAGTPCRAPARPTGAPPSPSAARRSCSTPARACPPSRRSPSSAPPASATRSSRTCSSLPAPPSKPRPSPVPWIVMMMPVLMGIALYVTTRSTYALMYVLVWPFMGLGTWWQQKRTAERQFAEEPGRVAAGRRRVCSPPSTTRPAPSASRRTRTTRSRRSSASAPRPGTRGPGRAARTAPASW
ncbi:hypothetical protein [Nocardioides convexus]|uniref:hypothetical protein n=1 Tax=Nocardioides convexus TaxID=2712224 RepID=UPI002418672D|nr:hypothetical protein [Nocardioides convexus]